MPIGDEKDVRHEAAEIGGFLPLDLAGRGPFHERAIGFNTARGALRWLLNHITSRGAHIERLWFPAFNCPTVADTISNHFPHLKVAHYNISPDLAPECPSCSSGGELIYFYNVFGLKGTVTRTMPAGTIVDNVHAFYTAPCAGHHTIYSARKFFGVPDGAYLYSDLDLKEPPPPDAAWPRGAFLLKRHDVGARESYADFLASEDSLARAAVTGMSVLAGRLLAAIDYDAARRRRGENFKHLHDVLAGTNELRDVIDRACCDPDFVPFSYPWLCSDGLRVRRDLIERSVFVPTLWTGILDSAHASAFEKRLARDVVHLPVDQRYGCMEMDYILNSISAIV